MKHTNVRHSASPTGTPLAPVRRLDATAVLAEIAEHAGLTLELLGPAPGGQVGAAYVRRHAPGGRSEEGVLTWSPHGSPEAVRHLHRTAEVLDLARARGIPVPRYELITAIPDGIAVVQERLPGLPPRRPGRPLVQAMVAANEGFAGLLADRPDVPVPEMYLDRSADGFCLHESLERYDARTRRLLAWVREVGRDEPGGMTGADLVHLDFHTGNVLVDANGALSGIVDWDGLGRGDRHFALVTLRFDLSAPERDTRPTPGHTLEGATAATADRPAVRSAGCDPASWLDEVLDDLLDPVTLRLYWAHMSLRMVDWSIRHFGPAEVAHWLEFAASRRF